jgi:predicted nucleic acid-binding protein
MALLGVAYRFNSEDTRNSPTLTLANYLRDQGVQYVMHDPYVKDDDQNLLKYNQQDNFTRDINKALESADYIFMCSAHKEYIDNFEKIVSRKNLQGVVDACNIYRRDQFAGKSIKYTGIGRGEQSPSDEFVDFVYKSFQAMEKGLATELQSLIDFYNNNYAYDEYNKVKFADVQRLAKTCSTGCEIADMGKIGEVPAYKGFSSTLVQKAFELSKSFAG